MKVAVTGGRGRLAPLVAKYFRAKGEDVRVYSRNSGEGFASYEDFEPADVVIHCAWSSVPFTAEADPDITKREDLPLLGKLMECAKNALIVFPSTGAVYGNTGKQPADETTPPAPLGAYARGKLEAETLLLENCRDRCLILRTTNLLGESDDPKKPQGVLPRIISAAKTGDVFPVWGDGSSTKDYLHTSDFLRALDVLIQGKQTGLYNVGRGESVELLRLIEMVEVLTGYAVRIQNLPHYPWDVSQAWIAVDKLSDLGWEPHVSLEKAISLCLKS